MAAGKQGTNSVSLCNITILIDYMPIKKLIARMPNVYKETYDCN